ncbi:hypothetical protein CRG98_007685 [Punica granatum]|uniref:Uncharacterized protein n=1 Tax=Punica granatum TaxID=22663 RepID=A0A2I0KTU8_PUNGR|nr:hypothetical protein CRG98_007685 [Punica granatum]
MHSGSRLLDGHGTLLEMAHGSMGRWLTRLGRGRDELVRKPGKHLGTDSENYWNRILEASNGENNLTNGLGKSKTRRLHLAEFLALS